MASRTTVPCFEEIPATAPTRDEQSIRPAVAEDAPVSERTTLARTADRIVTHLAEARRAEAKARFAIGDEIHAVRCAAAMRPRAVGRLAVRLALDESGLQRMGRVAECILRPERVSLLLLTDPRGLCLTWSHLERLERIHGVPARLALAREILAEGLSVRQLRERFHR